ncbi:MAG: DUF4388 domain-containing protein [Roseiflexaceae bacterium]|nr:DUF4388 domain-containing protein [Roseiflexaceae bacterium]
MALEGTFEDMSLVDLFQIFRTGNKSGVLLVVGDTEQGVIYVYQGCLIDAVLVQGSERKVTQIGEEAVLCLLRWEDASFTFRHDLAVKDRPVRIQHDSEWLSLEALRRRDRPLRLLAHQQITLDTQLSLAALPATAQGGVNLNLDQWRILSQIAISQNLHDISAQTGMAPEVAIRTVTELVAVGLVDVAPPPVRPARLIRLPVPTHQPPMVPALAGMRALTGMAAADVGEVSAGRGLLHAIMRKIRRL